MPQRSYFRAGLGPFKERISNKHRLDFIEAVVNSFWKKWSRDVFPNMVMQPKWHVARRNVQKDDVVLIQDSNVIRGEWKMGVVTETHPGDDGKVRRVTVSYKNIHDENSYGGIRYTRIERPVQRLIVLIPAEERQTIG